MKSDDERLRRRYRPAKIRLLFIGEAPPASGRFFYRQDSGLYRAIREAYATIDPSVTGDRFLTIFKASGCYLIDACAEPVDHLDARSRRVACLASEQALGKQIGRLRPQAIVILLRSIHGIVQRAAERAGWHGAIIDVPYPGRWIRHREIFLRELLPHLKDLLGVESKG
jgi:hypothetical protein